MWDRSSVLFTENALGHYSRYDRYDRYDRYVRTPDVGARFAPRGPPKNFIEIYAKFGYPGCETCERNLGGLGTKLWSRPRHMVHARVHATAFMCGVIPLSPLTLLVCPWTAVCVVGS